jgi:hypothetical protein
VLLCCRERMIEVQVQKSGFDVSRMRPSQDRDADKECLLGFVLTSVYAIVRLDYDARYGKGAGHRKREQDIATLKGSKTSQAPAAQGGMRE